MAARSKAIQTLHTIGVGYRSVLLPPSSCTSKLGTHVGNLCYPFAYGAVIPDKGIADWMFHLSIEY